MINIFKKKQKFQPPNQPQELYYSVPLLFDYGYIQELIKLNSQDKAKYKIRSIYNSLPVTSYAKSGYEHRPVG